MLILPQKTFVTWNSKNKQWYVNLGYEFTKMGKIFEVDVNDLTIGSYADVKVLCDYCGSEITMEYHTYIMLKRKFKGITEKDCCSNTDCVNTKTKEVNLIRYGVEYLKQNPEYQKMLEENLLNKRGVINVFQLEEIKNKAKETHIIKYGAEHFNQTEEGKEKHKQTCQEKYGVNSVFQTEEFKIKSKNTCLIKYGVPSCMQNKEIKNKAIKTLFRNSNAPKSIQQIYICQLIGGILNYPFSNCLLDIAFPEKNIYLEYNGGGHNLSVKMGDITQKEFDRGEQLREIFLKSKGWKEIKIVSKYDKLPLDEEIINLINLAKDYLNSGHTWIEFNIDEQLIRCSQFEIKYNYDKLRNIYKKDVYGGEACLN